MALIEIIGSLLVLNEVFLIYAIFMMRKDLNGVKGELRSFRGDIRELINLFRDFLGRKDAESAKTETPQEESKSILKKFWNWVK